MNVQTSYTRNEKPFQFGFIDRWSDGWINDNRQKDRETDMTQNLSSTQNIYNCQDLRRMFKLLTEEMTNPFSFVSQTDSRTHGQVTTDRETDIDKETDMTQNLSSRQDIYNGWDIS